MDAALSLELLDLDALTERIDGRRTAARAAQTRLDAARVRLLSARARAADAAAAVEALRVVHR